MNRRLWIYQVASAAMAARLSAGFSSNELRAGACDPSSEKLDSELSETLVRVRQALDRILQEPGGFAEDTPVLRRVWTTREIVGTAASLAADAAIVSPALLQTCCWTVEQICSEARLCRIEPSALSDLKADVQRLNRLLLVALTAGASTESRLWPLA